jgi:hypothetical protein
MKTTTVLLLAAVFALGAAAGCDRNPEPAGAGGTAPSTSPSPPTSQTPTTPANIGQPQSQAEKREGANPVQQQVDPKQGEQQRDFRMQGEGAGPRGGG